MGRLTSATDNAGTLSRTYDERGNLTQETRIIAGLTRLISYTFRCGEPDVISPLPFRSNYQLRTRHYGSDHWRVLESERHGCIVTRAVVNQLSALRADDRFHLR